MIGSNLRTTNKEEHFEAAEKENHLPTLDISCLPNETLAHIFSFSHPLSSILLVNKHWNDLAEAELHRQFPEATRKTNAYFLKFQNHPNGALLVKKRIENITDLKMFELTLKEKNFYWIFRSFREIYQSMPAYYNTVSDTLIDHEMHLYANFVCNLDANLKILNNELEFCKKNKLKFLLKDLFYFFIEPLINRSYKENDSVSAREILFVVQKYFIDQEITYTIPNIKLNQSLHSFKRNEESLNEAIKELMEFDVNSLHEKDPLDEKQAFKKIMGLIEPSLIFKLIDTDPETARSIAHLLAKESSEESKLYLEIIESIDQAKEINKKQYCGSDYDFFCELSDDESDIECEAADTNEIESVDQANFKKGTQEFKEYYKIMDAEKEISHEKEQDNGSNYEFFCELNSNDDESYIESETSDTDESDYPLRGCLESLIG